jgi:DNA-binding SARP family transcriptional activator
MAMLFAVTYPERVAGLVLNSTGAVLVPPGETEEQRERRRFGVDGIFTSWGTEETKVLQRCAPTAWNDPSYRAWEPRYERQSATPAAIRDLCEMIDGIDVTDILDRIDVPTLVLHRINDPVIKIEVGRRLAAGIRGAQLVELEGVDHFPHVGDIDSWIDEIERFVTGRAPVTGHAAAPVRHVVRITTFGGFEVVRDGSAVPLAAWGSRRARTLCKRLAAAAGAPVSRDELMELLWPDGNHDLGRLSARLSVQLSTVRRLLDGGVLADRDSVRLDLHEVSLDLVEFRDAVDRGDLEVAVGLHRGDFLPEDTYAEWTSAPREHARARYIRAARALAERAAAIDDTAGVVEHMQRVLLLDQFDAQAHIRLISTLHHAGHLGEARRAHERYVARMHELGVTAGSLDEVTTSRL